MEITKGVTLDLQGGKVVLSADLGSFANPVIDGLIAKVTSGAIDPIKGTDLDKDAMLTVLKYLKGELNK